MRTPAVVIYSIPRMDPCLRCMAYEGMDRGRGVRMPPAAYMKTDEAGEKPAPRESAEAGARQKKRGEKIA